MNGHDSSNWGFKDVVKNPEYWTNSSRVNATISKAVEQSKSWSDEEVSAAAKHFIFEKKTSGEAWGMARILRELGERTHPAVLEILANSSFYEKLLEPIGGDDLPETPFNRVCELLGDRPPEVAIDGLARFLSAASPRIRKLAALAIAKTGAPPIIPLVQQALSDTDPYVRSYALMGLKFAIAPKGLAEIAKQELFPSIMALIREEKNLDDATDILFILNNAKAKDYFLSPECFSADSPVLPQALKTLGNAKASIPRNLLLGLIKCLESKEMKPPWSYSLGGALRLLGQQMIEEDREFLRARVSSSNGAVARGASNGLLSSLGLEDFELRLWEKNQTLGYEALSEQQKFYIAVQECDGEINNGGLAQYFVNSSGNSWPKALAGFEAVGLAESSAILKKAIAFFGSEGPSTHRKSRQEQLAKLYRTNEATFDDLDSRYYDKSEDIEICLENFVRENPEGFLPW